ncbi:NAD(P)/FAD-dependent oxidoreductase [Pseudomonas aeruginosa]|uniref:NAD(P)/FAD-dependent oxidoreductase n=1 Tax=Pseudomonas aeruginosa TaxID=287 RepID=UPI003CC617C6
MKPHYDLAIVGGGIIGAWSLYLAQQRNPDWSIVLIDRYRVASGATAHSAGVLLATGHSERERRLAATSARLYKEITKSQRLVTTCSDVYWVTSPEHKACLEAATVGFSVDPTPIVPSDLQDRLAVPLWVDDDEIALRGGQAISHDPGLIVRTLISYSLHSPHARCIEGVAITAAQKAGGTWKLQLDNGHQLEAIRVISCLGPWLVDGPFGTAAAQYKVRTKKVVAMHVDRIPPRQAAALFFPQSDAYLMPLPTRNQWLFSFRAEAWDRQPERSQLDISAEDASLAKTILDRYQPGLAASLLGGRAFCDAYTPTGEPLVAHDQAQGWIVAGAGSGAGFRLAPGIADEAVRIVAG